MEGREAVRKYDLETRTYTFANNCKEFLKRISRSIHNHEYYRQLIRSSASVAANYIEANESFSKNDCIFRVKICRKEAKESSLWLRLIDVEDIELNNRRNILIQETTELTKIFGAIVEKAKLRPDK